MWNSTCFRGCALWGWHWLSFLVLGLLISWKVKWIEVKRSEFFSFHTSIVGFCCTLCAMQGESNALSPILWGWSSLLYHWSLHLLATLLHLNDDLWNCFVPIHVAALSEAVCVSVGLHCGGSGIGLSFSSLLDCRLASCKVKWSELSLRFYFLHKSLRCT